MTSLTVDAIFDLYQSKGQDAYRGESVSQLDHALQSAYGAQLAGADAPLIVAALLHDYGHYVHDMEGLDIMNGVHDQHDARGASALAAIFPPSVTEPVRLHVEAKRYLCAIDPDYLEALSFGSRFSLQVQGGPYSEDEARAFEALPFALDAAKVRRWDDGAKVAGLKTPDLEAFRPIVLACLKD